jgi:predicted 3-demethylubiquinone-9 3-methyltransferase (glyoxalase superfamily)
MQKILPCLWFDGQAENAVQFYTTTFKNSKIDAVSYYGNEGPGLPGNVLTMTFHLNGQEMMH